MKNKEQIAKIWDVLDSLNVDVLHNKQAIIKLENEREKPQLKQLDQSAFDHPYVDDRFKYVALNADSQAVFFESKPVISNCLDIWVVHTGSIMPMLKGYDASNWKTSLIERETKPQLNQLDHSIFDGLEGKWRFAAIDGGTGRVYVYEQKPQYLHESKYWHIQEGLQRFIGEGYDISNCKNSLIKRETIELTGSDLARAMLARGDRVITCLISNESDDEAIKGGLVHAAIITDVGSLKERFVTLSRNFWSFAVPINNQGEPLTSSDVGL